MAKNLIIVESPAKAKTIHKILGPDFDVTSSMGHLRDLPASRLGVDVEKDFEPHYIVIQKRRKFAKELQEAARNREAIYLAPDPDREGEAISWHLDRLLRDDEAAQAEKAKKEEEKKAKKAAAKAASGDAPPPAPAKKAAKGKKAAEANGRKIFRITFHEITPDAIKAAVKQPREIDQKLVNAQQARRILDRLVGYSLSPLLWKKIGRGLSAGRVQSVALRLIVDREKEIEAFVPKEYWSIETELKKADGGAVFKAQLATVDGKKFEAGTKADADALAQELRAQKGIAVAAVDEKEQKRYPKPPFTTSTLQQEAFNKLGYSSARTMRIAQQLYEGMEIGEASPVGLITYMRTDSVRVADEAMKAVRALIPQKFGKAFLPEAPRPYKSKKSAQEAHEAVRPTSVNRTPEAMRGFLDDDQYALYQLIWQRFVASQMTDAVDRVVAVQISAGKFGLKANGRNNVFAGWTQAYQDKEEEAEDERLPEGVLPPLAKGDALTLAGVVPSQHFTKPPRRFTDASLVKALEEQGIGRPSTYAPTIMTIVSRDYVRRQGGSLVPQKLGTIVIDLLTEHFPEVMDLKFTAEMEEELDRIEEGDLEWVSVVRHFYTPFSSRVTVANEKMKEFKREVIKTEYVCEKCGKGMVIKWGRFGQFLSCEDYPNCKNAKPVPTGVKCPEANCGGDLVERKARGRHFYGCSNYPACRYTARRLEKVGQPAAANGDGKAEQADDEEGDTIKE